jgi:pimeloyl-ACP methyl ester carboxylesterase
VDSDDATGKTRYDQIIDDLKSLLAKYPDYKIFVTGHSLGAALSSVAAFYFACDDDLPKPISCINFASPRSGGWEVFQGVQHLEQTKKRRVLRVVNENDLVTTSPSLGYWHSGWQVNTYKPGWFNKNPKPDIEYLSPLDSAWKRFGKTWTNSIASNFNLGYDHSDYISRIEFAKNYLVKTNLNALYMDEKKLGYKLGGDESAERVIAKKGNLDMCCGQ